ncbi:HEAT repeat domain-containing protein [Ideonella sp. DXS29W]|uniref:HEAT repeat domain-containing protein n=1 Tax=Ideonella lacteola TaxID=2984193 RepID=A0ABU9BVA1_9BURK
MGLRKTPPTPLHQVQDREHPRDLEGLIEQLDSSNSTLRRWAARDLANHPPAVSALGEALAREADTSVREALFTSLSAIAGESAVRALLPLLRSEQAPLRNGAIEALAAMPDDVAPSISALLNDPDVDVRLFTVNLMGELRHPSVCTWLVQVLRAESQINVVAAAIEVLTEVGGSAERPALLEVRSRFEDDPFLVFAVDLALSRIEAT